MGNPDECALGENCLLNYPILHAYILHSTFLPQLHQSVWISISRAYTKFTDCLKPINASCLHGVQMLLDYESTLRQYMIKMDHVCQPGIVEGKFTIICALKVQNKSAYCRPLSNDLQCLHRFTSLFTKTLYISVQFIIVYVLVYPKFIVLTILWPRNQNFLPFTNLHQPAPTCTNLHQLSPTNMHRPAPKGIDLHLH